MSLARRPRRRAALELARANQTAVEHAARVGGERFAGELLGKPQDVRGGPSIDVDVGEEGWIGVPGAKRLDMRGEVAQFLFDLACVLSVRSLDDGSGQTNREYHAGKLHRRTNATDCRSARVRDSGFRVPGVEHGTPRTRSTESEPRTHRCSSKNRMAIRSSSIASTRRPS